MNRDEIIHRLRHLTFQVKTLKNRAEGLGGEPEPTDSQIQEGIADLVRTITKLVPGMREKLERADWLIADLEVAAGELMISPIPEPGTDLCRLLLANRILHRRIQEDRDDIAVIRDVLDKRKNVKTDVPK